jgi:hypothetical protein
MACNPLNSGYIGAVCRCFRMADERGIAPVLKKSGAPHFAAPEMLEQFLPFSWSSPASSGARKSNSSISMLAGPLIVSERRSVLITILRPAGNSFFSIYLKYFT